MPELTTSERLIQSYERKYAIAARAMLRKQLQPCMVAIRQGVANPEAFILPIEVDRYFSDLYGEVGTNFAEISYTTLKGQAEKSIVDRWLLSVRDFIRRYLGDRIQGITDTSKEIVRRMLSTAKSEGWGVSRTISELRKKWNQLSKARSVLIAQSEVLTATNAGVLLGANAVSQALGVEMEKTWVAKIDSHTRDAHAATNGQKRPLTESFSVNGVAMAYPGDPAGGMKNVARCRCRLKVGVKN